MTTHTGTSVTVRSFEDADEPAVLELLQTSLGAGPTGVRDPSFFGWKHRRSPFGRSFMLVAESEGAVVGLRAFMRWRFTANARTFSAVRAVDTATHPDHQGRGIFSRLTHEALDALRPDVDFVFNTPNGKSLPGYLKMGWLPVGTIPISIRIRRPVRFARGARKLGSDESAPVASAPAVRAAPAASLRERSSEIESLLSVSASAPDRLATPKDLTYLLWRYADAPGLGYHVVFDGSTDGLRGFAVFRVRPRGSLWESTVAEVVTAHGDARSAGRLLRGVSRASDVDHVACHLSAGSPQARAGARAMFVKAPRGMTFVVNPLSVDLDPDPQLLGSWALSLGDVEVF